MDFREALIFLVDELPTIPVEKLMEVADHLVVATSPYTAERAAAEVYSVGRHFDRKILFIKDVREKVREVTGTPCGLKEAKDAAEKFLEDLAAHEDEAWDLVDDGWKQFAESRERQAEQGSWFGPVTAMDEETF